MSTPSNVDFLQKDAIQLLAGLLVVSSSVLHDDRSSRVQSQNLQDAINEVKSQVDQLQGNERATENLGPNSSKTRGGTLSQNVTDSSTPTREELISVIENKMKPKPKFAARNEVRDIQFPASRPPRRHSISHPLGHVSRKPEAH